MDTTEDFNADPFFTDGSLQQIDAAGIDALNAAVPIPFSPQVIQRILNLQASGCLARIAWSRGGHLARIAEDGVSVDIQTLVFDPQRCSWTLSTKHNENSGLGELNSLAWSPAGSDLAVVDAQGRLSILRPQSIALNRFTQPRSGVVDEPDEYGQAIGLFWLGQDRPGQPKTAIQYASKTETRWVHHPARSMPLGPLSKRAVISVNRKGILSLIFESGEGNAGLTRLSTQLTPKATEIFTHAAFAPTTEGKLLVALYSYTGELSTYFVKIDIPQSTGANAALSVEPAATKLFTTGSSGLMAGQVHDPDSCVLTHLGIIPSSEVQTAVQNLPTVFGVFSNVDKNVSATEPGFFGGSTIMRWTIASTPMVLHPRFDELPVKGKDTESTSTTFAERLVDKNEQVITCVSLTDAGQHSLYITTQDGRTDFLSNEDLSSLTYQGSVTEATSLTQSGFGFPLISAPSYVVLSPNSCVAALINESDKIELNAMDCALGTDDSSAPAADSIVAAVILALSRAIWGTASMEDILSVVIHNFGPSYVIPLATHLYRTLFKETEFINDREPGNDLEKVVQKPVLTKVLAFHYMVSFLALKNAAIPPRPSKLLQRRPHTFDLPLSGQWAWVVGNLRFVAFLLHGLNREIANPKSTLSPDLVEIVCGNIKWTLDLVRYIVQKILEVEDRETNPDFFPPPKEGEIVDGSQGLVSLLLNCHWSRQFFVVILKVIRVLGALPEPRSRSQILVLRAIAEGSQGKGVGLRAIETLLMGDWSRPGDVGEASEQAARQVEMMATGVVTGGYQGTVKRLLQKSFGVQAMLRQEGPGKSVSVDRLKLWEDEIDEGWLMLEEKGGRRFDVHKKKVIKQGVKEGENGPLMIKKCIRCGRFSEDISGKTISGSVAKYVNVLMIKCTCDGNWIIESWEGSSDRA